MAERAAILTYCDDIKGLDINGWRLLIRSTNGAKPRKDVNPKGYLAFLSVKHNIGRASPPVTYVYQQIGAAAYAEITGHRREVKIEYGH